MQEYTLHTHTLGFDGRNTVQEMVNRAKTLGVKTIGISNHFIVHPHIKDSVAYYYARRGGYSNIYAANFSEAVQRFINNYAIINSARNANPDIKILRGMEVDFFHDIKWMNRFHMAVKILKPDYIIGAKHFVEYNDKLLNAHDLANADQRTQEILLTKYWQDIAIAAKSGLFDWMAHLDLPKKVGLGRAEKWAEYETIAVESAAKSNTALEINTSYYRPDYYEPYPSIRILRMVAKNDVPVLISDDAHRVENLTNHFEDAEKLISNLNLKRFTKIKQM